eukprot:6174574-Prymnesium_polylepis.1
MGGTELVGVRHAHALEAPHLSHSPSGSADAHERKGGDDGGGGGSVGSAAEQTARAEDVMEAVMAEARCWQCLHGLSASELLDALFVVGDGALSSGGWPEEALAPLESRAEEGGEVDFASFAAL